MKNFLSAIKEGFINGMPSKQPKFWSYLCMFMAGEFFVLFELQKSLLSLVFFAMMIGITFYWMRRIPAKKEESSKNEPPKQ